MGEESSDDEYIDPEYGTIDPQLWDDDDRSRSDPRISVESLSYLGRTHDDIKKKYGVEDDQEDELEAEYYDDRYKLPLVSYLLQRPHMINQVMSSCAALESDLLEVTDPSAVNDAYLLPSTRHLITHSAHFRDPHGRRIRYAPSGAAPNSSLLMSRWVVHSRSLLLSRARAETLGEEEKVAVARGFFLTLVLKHWRRQAGKQGTFRRVMLRFYCHHSFKHWAKASREVGQGLKFVRAFTRFVYARSFSRLNAHRLASKVLQIMNLRFGNSQRACFQVWLTFSASSLLTRDRSFGAATRRNAARLLARWRANARAERLFKRCIMRVAAVKEARAFAAWRAAADWLTFVKRFKGTAVERAVHRAYYRWCCKTWLDYTLKRRKMRKGLNLLFKSGRTGLLTKGFNCWVNRFRPTPSKKKPLQRTQRKIGFCTCIYALCHGGHCTCSFEVHFKKRIENFGTVLKSSDDILLRQSGLNRRFERDYETGLRVSLDAGTKKGEENDLLWRSVASSSTSNSGSFANSRERTSLMDNLKFVKEGAATVEYDLNGRKIVKKNIHSGSRSARGEKDILKERAAKHKASTIT